MGEGNNMTRTTGQVIAFCFLSAFVVSTGLIYLGQNYYPFGGLTKFAERVEKLVLEESVKVADKLPLKWPSKLYIGSDPRVTVNTIYGNIEGTKSIDSGMNTFLGVPYASPPLGDLRFRKTAPLQPWNATIKATQFSPNCMQHRIKQVDDFVVFSDDMSEDCLYLNIWTPTLAQKEGKLKAVMFWIHGGGFVMGSVAIEENDGKILSLLGDVVVVTFNYRLGAFGFLDLEVEGAAGNQGLFDQAMALNWVKDNIKQFGGDPNEITVFGQSAGAFCTNLLMVSPFTKHLFKRAILESGTGLTVPHTFYLGRRNSMKVIENLGCVFAPNATADEDYDEEHIHQSVDCLRGKKSADFFKRLDKFSEVSLDMVLLPSANDEFLPQTPSELFFGENAVNGVQGLDDLKEVLIGSNSDEAAIALHLLLPDIFRMDKIDINITTVEELVDILSQKASDIFHFPKTQIKTFLDFLLKDGPQEDSAENMVRRLCKTIGEQAFVCPIEILGDSLVKGNKSVYTYEFSYKSPTSPWGDWMGAIHGSELLYVFGYPLRYPSRHTKEDIAMSKRIIKAWAHFARYGTMPSQRGVKWSQYSVKNREYMVLNPRKVQLKTRGDSKTCDMVRDMYAALM